MGTPPWAQTVGFFAWHLSDIVCYSELKIKKPISFKDVFKCHVFCITINELNNR